MELLGNFLDEEDIEQIEETFDEELLNSLDIANMLEIINFLRMMNIDFIKDIIICYLDLFLWESEEFKRRFLRLREKYAKGNFNELLGHKLDILEEMYK